jgi:hypothetical protein
VPKPDRKERLAEQLRANLRKRKQQERARGVLSGDEKHEGRAVGDHPKEALQSSKAKLADKHNPNED